MVKLKKMAPILAAAALATTPANAKPNTADMPAPAEQRIEQRTEGNRFLNGLKFICGLPYTNTEKYPENSASAGLPKKQEHRAFWGLSHSKDVYFNTEGGLKEIRDFSWGDEVRREEFHSTGALAREADRTDNHNIGTVKSYDERGFLTTERNYDNNGNLHGLTSFYNTAGDVIRSVPYENGKRNGEERIFDELGEHQIAGIPYVNDAKHGREYNNQLGTFTNYDMGKPVGAFRERIPGKDNSDYTMESGSYKDGERHVSQRDEYQRGQLTRRTPFDEKGNIHGDVLVYNDGDIRETIPYEHGQIHGEHKDGSNFTTYNHGRKEGPYKTTSPLLTDIDGKSAEETSVDINKTVEGVWKDGQNIPQKTSYQQITMMPDGTIHGQNLTELEAKYKAKGYANPERADEITKEYEKAKAAQQTAVPKTPEVKTPETKTVGEKTSEAKTTAHQKGLREQLSAMQVKPAEKATPTVEKAAPTTEKAVPKVNVASVVQKGKSNG